MSFLPVDIVKVNARSESVVVETLAPVRGIKVLFLWKIATIKSEIAFSFSTDGKEWHLRPNFTLFLVTATQIRYCTLFLSYKNIAFPAWAEYSYFSAFPSKCKFKGCKFQASTFNVFELSKLAVSIAPKFYFADWQKKLSSFSRIPFLYRKPCTRKGFSPFKIGKTESCDKLI